MGGRILDELIYTGVRLLILDRTYHNKPAPIPTDDDVRQMIESVMVDPPKQIDMPPAAGPKEFQSLFARNRKLLAEAAKVDADIDLSDFDRTNSKCLKAHAEICFNLAVFLSSGLLNELEDCCDTVLREANLAAGYWSEKIKQGQNSAELGLWSMEKAKELLKKYGGIAGYDNLPRGKKSKVIEEVADELKFRDVRQAYNILKKLRKK
ncbi:MAG: hypothetical protein RBQ87_09805 [Candidatus Cloacimonadaceae bacterium]|jgi:hypothetical protein|nr:hypothetical protein [Candidatus Cloacimonadaceae bacterium]